MSSSSNKGRIPRFLRIQLVLVTATQLPRILYVLYENGNRVVQLSNNNILLHLFDRIFNTTNLINRRIINDIRLLRHNMQSYFWL